MQSKQSHISLQLKNQPSTCSQGWGATYPQHQRPIRGDCADNCTISAPDVTWVEKHLTQGFLPAKFFCVSRTQRTKDLNLLLFSTRLAKERDQRLQILDQGLILGKTFYVKDLCLKFKFPKHRSFENQKTVNKFLERLQYFFRHYQLLLN